VIAWMIATYRLHGTKLLGLAATVYSGFVAVIAMLASTPAVQIVVAPRTFAYLLIGNAFLGLVTTRRGFVNSRNLNAAP